MESDRCFSTGLLSVTIALAFIDGLIISTFAFYQDANEEPTTWLDSSEGVPSHDWLFKRRQLCVFYIESRIYLQEMVVLVSCLWIRLNVVDLCHQANDEEEEDEEDTCQVGLLDKSKTAPGLSTLGHHRKCCPLHFGHVGSRQKFVILVVFLIFVMMMAFAVLIWIGTGKNSIDSSIVARVYIYFFAIAILLLAGALAVYGLVLFLKMSKVRSDKASFEMWKVAGLAIVCVVCFTSSAVVALSTNIPLLYHWHPRDVNGILTSILVFLYYFIGSSVPSAYVLWIMRELPPAVAIDSERQSSIVTFMSDTTAAMHNSQRWTTATSSQNQASRASPI
ncbi:hypothetical protein IFM89_030363 [Coptis chinensis]|uniref:THH1/TOM1/TOM3 domain-containing protein n=1 Tax=Coptis chinensis TaxID=261450 RepID=A0A835LJX4_9MAGN|nr:hypothetical protein IFM89_030363 [Coptis chinensis]